MSTWRSKHVEAENKLIIKFSASSWLITKTNILKCTVSKIYKKNMRNIPAIADGSVQIRSFHKAQSSGGSAQDPEKLTYIHSS